MKQKPGDGTPRYTQAQKRSFKNWAHMGSSESVGSRGVRSAKQLLTDPLAFYGYPKAK